MRKIDVSELVDSSEVAQLLGLASANAARVYQRRYGDFPAPAVDKGRCLLWLRAEIEAWAERRSR